MSDGEFLPKSEAELVQWATQFITVASMDATVVGLTWASVQDITTKRNDFQAAITSAKSAKEAAKGATSNKITKMKDLSGTARQLARTVQGKAGVPAQKKRDMGLTVRVVPEKPVNPSIPIGVTVIAESRTDNLIKWARGENHRGTMYEIEVSYGSNNSWQYLMVVTTLSFRHQNVPEGSKIYYRLRALRKGVYSDYSSEVSPTVHQPKTPPLAMKKAA